MNIVPTSGGIEWTSDGNAYLDAMPISGPSRQTLSLPQIVAATREMAWQTWTPAMSQTHDLRAFTGVIGNNRKANVLLRFIYKHNANPLDALYAIESLDTLPGAIAQCIWTAITAVPVLTNEHAIVIPTIYSQLRNSNKPAKRLSKHSIERFVANHINAVVNQKEAELPDGAVNRARFWIDLSAAMWKNDNLHRLGAVANMSLLMPYNELAVMWLAIRPDLTYRVGKQEVHPPIITNGSAWTEALIWSVKQIPAETIRFFSNFRVTDRSWNAMKTAPDLDMQQTDAIAAGLVREARARQAYTASGQFVLALPKHLPWRESAIHALAIYAQPHGLWVAGLTASNERTASFWWEPTLRSAANLQQYTLAENPLAHVTLAAFWHDLIVAGDEVIITAGQSTRPPARHDAPASNLPRPSKPGTVITLPRRSVHLTGNREWSSAADREIITRRSHGVRGHLRQLPQTWQRSEQAEHEANEWGFVLPDGYTFVRPHVRGDHDRDPAPVIAKARGLQTISALLQ